jgi:hypothetical protein
MQVAAAAVFMLVVPLLKLVQVVLAVVDKVVRVVFLEKDNLTLFINMQLLVPLILAVVAAAVPIWRIVLMVVLALLLLAILAAKSLRVERLLHLVETRSIR